MDGRCTRICAITLTALVITAASQAEEMPTLAVLPLNHIGVAASGNEVGLSQAEFDALSEEERESLVATASESLQRVGAHIVVDGIWDGSGAVDRIEQRLATGGTP